MESVLLRQRSYKRRVGLVSRPPSPTIAKGYFFLRPKALSSRDPSGIQTWIPKLFSRLGCRTLLSLPRYYSQDGPLIIRLLPLSQLPYHLDPSGREDLNLCSLDSEPSDLPD